MKTLAVSIFASGLTLFIAAAPYTIEFGMQNHAGNNPGFAVVELYTSEGCSSCPPADALIAKIQKENEGKPIYILAFHVDYWNRLGWKDMFSDPAFTKRQRQYASWLNLSSVYTPQIVVNGSTELVGSQEPFLRKAIADGLGKKAEATISLENVKAIKDQIVFDYQVSEAVANWSLAVALVQKAAESKVRSGENAGRTLSHVQIVRAMETVNLNGNAKGTVPISLPDGVKGEGLELIIFVQNYRSGEIIAANKVELGSTIQTVTAHESH